MNFPTTHYLNHSGRAGAVVGQADVLIGLELTDFWNTVNAYIDNGENLRESRVKSGATLISIGAGDYYIKSNYQDFQRYQAVDVPIAGDAEATLPSLIEAVRLALASDRKDAFAKRGEALRKAAAENRARTLVARPPVEGPFRRPIGVIHRRTRELSAPARTFLALLTSTLAARGR